MAIVGTVLGAALSLFMAFVAAGNIAPKWLYSLLSSEAFGAAANSTTF